MMALRLENIPLFVDRPEEPRQAPWNIPSNREATPAPAATNASVGGNAPTGRRAPAVLLLLGGIGDVGCHPLAVGTNTVGRLSDNDVVVASDYVSRRHCAIVAHPDGRCEVYDIGSINGVRVNGKRITGLMPLKHRDV